MVQKRASPFGQGGRESKIVQQFAAGFTPRSEQTEREKAEQRDWDRAAVLAVGADDPQAKIYEQFAERANTNAEGVSTRKGLGCGGEGGSAPGGRASLRRGVAFVSAGGAPAPTPVAAAAFGANGGGGGGGGADAAALTRGQTPSHHTTYPSNSHASASSCSSAHPPHPPRTAQYHTSLPAGWTSQLDPRSGVPYYVHTATGTTQWEPPPMATAPTPTSTPPLPPPPLPSLPPGWCTGVDPATGAVYYANPYTGQTQWTPPSPPPPQPPLPPTAPPPLPPQPHPPTASANGAHAAAAHTISSTYTPTAPTAPIATPTAAAAAARTLLDGAAVRVTGVPSEMSEGELRELLCAHGHILSVTMERGAYSAGRTPKVARVVFDAVGSAQRAVDKMDGVSLRGTKLSVTIVD